MSGAITLRYFVILLLLVPTAIYALLPLRDTLGDAFRKKIVLLCGAILGLIIVLSLLGGALSIAPKRIYFIGLLPLFGIYYAITDDRLVKKLFCFLNSTMIVMNALVYGIILAAPIELENPETVYRILSGLICLLCAAALGVIYWKTLTVKIPYLINSEALALHWRYAVLVPAIVALMFYWVVPRSAAVVMTGRVRITILVFLMLGPITFLMVYQAFWRIAVNLWENAQLKAENELRQMESKRYEELRSYMNETRAMRHDFRQHLLVLDEYAKNGETEKLTDYIMQFTASLADHKGSFAANPAVDAVASHYDQTAQSQNTHIKWLLELPEVLPFVESDFITIFGNLVENALHGVETLPEEKRSVHVTARMLSDAMLGLTVKNPYEGVIKLGKNGLPKSTRSGGGVGLSSVEAAVHRYNGVLDINTDDGVFTAGVLLYANQ